MVSFYRECPLGPEGMVTRLLQVIFEPPDAHRILMRVARNISRHVESIL